MNQTKFMKTTRIVDRILGILQVLVIIVGIAAAVLIPIVLMIQDTTFFSVTEIDLGNASLTLSEAADQYVDFALVKRSVFVMFASGIIICPIYYYGIGLIRNVLEPMKEGQPFLAGVSDNIRKLAWVVLVGGLLDEGFSMIGYAVDVAAYDLTKLFDGSVVTGLTLNHTISANFLLTAVLLFLLSYVFRYGEQLQKESDETL